MCRGSGSGKRDRLVCFLRVGKKEADARGRHHCLAREEELWMIARSLKESSQ